MTKERRQTLLLILLGVVFVFVILRAMPSLTGGGGGGGAGRRPSASRSQAAGVQVLELRLADLDRETGEYRPGRDPFRYAEPPRPVAPPRPEPKPEVTEAQERLAETRLAAAAEPPKPKPPPIDVIYLGSFGPDERKIAVFSDDDTIYNAGVGDVVSDKFILVQIGFESVDLKFVGFPDEPAQRLAVGG